MTGQLSLLRGALEARLQAMTGYLGDANTQWENTTISPASDQPYQIVNILFASPLNETWGRFFQERGFMQVRVMYPTAEGPGAGDAMEMAQKIRDCFYRGLSLAAGSVTVQIEKTPEIAPGAVEGDRYSVPVKIRFIANNPS